MSPIDALPPLPLSSVAHQELVYEISPSKDRNLRLPKDSSLGADEKGIFLTINGKKAYIPKELVASAGDYFEVLAEVDGRVVDLARLLDIRMRFLENAGLKSSVDALDFLTESLRIMGIKNIDFKTQKGLTESCVKCHSGETFTDKEKLDYVGRKVINYLKNAVILVIEDEIIERIMQIGEDLFMESEKLKSIPKQTPTQEPKKPQPVPRPATASQWVQAKNQTYGGSKFPPHLVAQRNRGNNQRG